MKNAPPEFSIIKSSLYSGLGKRLRGDVSNFKDRRQKGQTLLPQLKEGRYFHIVPDTTCFNSTYAKCTACQKAKRLSNFWLADNPGKLAAKRNFVLDACCNACRALERETSLAGHPGYTPELDGYWTANFRSLVSGAHARGIEISITKDVLLERYLRNEGKCEVTGVLLKPASGKANRLAPSVDRIDSSGDYSPGNIQIVARCVNLMKGDMQSEEFYEWCKRIADRKA